MQIDPQPSSLSFVYPFLFDEREFDAHAHAADEAVWQGGSNAQGKLKVWRTEEFCVDDMISYVADFLNPPPDAHSPVLATARLWAIEDNSLQSPYGLGAKTRWTLLTPRGRIPFQLENVRLALFRDGVGFLTVFVQPSSGATPLTLPTGGGSQPAGIEHGEDSWLDFIHYFRFVAGQRNVAISAERDLDNPALLPYDERQWFVFSLDGGAFVAFDAPPTDFFRKTLPSHLEDQYFLLFLLSLEQRFALMKMQDAVAGDWLPLERGNADPDPGGLTQDADEARRRSFARIRDLLLSFTARSYFTQVMQQEHHHRVYRKWQEIFQVDKLYTESVNAVQDMHTDLQMRHEEGQRALAEEQKRRDGQQEKRSKNMQRALSAILWVLGVPGLALSYLGTGSSQGWEVTTWVFVGALLLGAAIFVTINFLHRPQSRK